MVRGPDAWRVVGAIGSGPEAGQPMYQAPLTLMTAPLTKLA